MELLKCCLEASNALKRADENTFDMCFDEIISDVFGGRRGLIKYLLTPHHKLDKNEIIQIKDILVNELQRLMDAKSVGSDDEDMDVDVDKARIIPSLLNISEHIQVYITSFLDFKSMKELKSVCSSIAPIAIGQFSKVDIRICNLQQLSNINQHLKTCRIIESNTKTFRVHRSDNVRAFAENELSIAPENLLHFDYYQDCDLTPHLIESTFDRIVDYIGLMNTASIIFADKTRMTAVESASSQHFYDPSPKLLFIQEFDVVMQKLEIKHIVRVDTSVSTQDIKNIIAHEDVSIFHLVDSNEYNYDVFDDGLAGEGLTMLSSNSVLALNEIKFSSVIYQVKNGNGTKTNVIKTEFHQRSEPFYDDFSKFHKVQRAEGRRPGLKYTDLAIKLRWKEVESEVIAKCYKKAYDLNPNDSLFIHNYVGALMDIDDTGTAQKICLEKLELYESEEIYISDDYLWEIYDTLAEIKGADDEDEEALLYYQKAIEVIQRMLPCSSSSTLIHEKKLKLCELCCAVACIHEASDETALNAKEYYEKIIEVFPNSAHYFNKYGDYLMNTVENYEAAMSKYAHAARIIENKKDQTPQLDCSAYDCYSRSV